MDLYTYPLLCAGTLVKRYQRFLADIKLETGELITAHCPNTGPMTGVCQIGAPVQVSYQDNPKRKLAYTWEMIQVDGIWVGINTALPKLEVEKAKLSGEFGSTPAYDPRHRSSSGKRPQRRTFRPSQDRKRK